jgi:DNA-binding transcriptional LysR family regulator
MLLDRIELFVNVAKHQNLAKTARGMHVSPSSVSQRLKSLENDFGVKLYKRSKSGIELTDAGRILLSTASQVLNQLDTLRRTLNPKVETPVQTLTVGATYNPSVRDVPSAIAAFQKACPDIKVRFLTSYRRTVEKGVRDGEIDIAMIQSPSESCIADFFTEHFAFDHLEFFASPGHPLTKKQKASVADLAQVPLVVREGTGTTQKMLSVLRSRGLTLNIALRCASPDAVKAAVRKKMGVGILFHQVIEEDIKRKEVKVLKVAGLPKLVGQSYIVYQKTKPLTVPATEFLALLRSMKPQLKSPVKDIEPS